jgi:hypothetical protein
LIFSSAAKTLPDLEEFVAEQTLSLPPLSAAADIPLYAQVTRPLTDTGTP